MKEKISPPKIPQLKRAEKRPILNYVIRTECEKFWSRGLINHPDFTLHGIQHSENIIEMLSKLIEESKIKFNKTELFLLEAAAYLHDIGMLIDLDDFIEEHAKEYWEREPTSCVFG
ncbi:MAG: hypothetical protein KAT65_17150 [Methanophagales archaeon]|nr:hypothetical protein [Methanophagales archaeon]